MTNGCNFEIFSTNSVQTFFAVAAVISEIISKILILVTSISKTKQPHFTSKYAIYFNEKYQYVTLSLFLN